MKDLERIYKAFANRRRLAIVSYLKKERGATVGMIAGKINLSFKATSKHLGVLTSANIVDKEQRGTQMHYRIADDLHTHTKQVISLL